MRLPYAQNPPRFENPKHQAFLERLLANRRAAARSGGTGLSELDLTLLHSPPLARGFLQFFTAVRAAAGTTLPADVAELAMCRVAALNGAAFEWMHHAPLLRKAGLGAEGLETVRAAEEGRQGRDGEGGLTAVHWAALAYIDEMTRSVKVSDRTFQGVRRYFDERQIVELSEYCLLVA
jgi:alkylhydroperoxidase family enzyme